MEADYIKADKIDGGPSEIVKSLTKKLDFDEDIVDEELQKPLVKAKPAIHLKK